LIVRGPGVPAGATASQLALNIDLAPTFADLTGVAPPDFVDGRSLTPLLRGEVSVSWRHEFLVERYGDVPPAQWGVATPSANPVAMTLDDEEESEDLQKISPVAAPPYLALRTDRYLYVEYVDGERELYDLAADPYALQNLALTADPVLIADLHDALEDLRTCATASCRNAEDALAVAARDGLPIPAPG
jgi:arylsulfatase A-like enzyme